MGSGEISARNERGRESTSGLPESAGKLEELQAAKEDLHPIREEPVMEISPEAIAKYRGIPPKRRRALVRRYKIRGWTNADLARLFSVRERTIERDLAAIREEVWGSLDTDEGARALLREIYAELRLAEDEVVREAWQLYMKTTNDSVKLGCLRLVGERQAELIKVMQSLGLLREAPQRVELSLAERVVSELLRGAPGAESTGTGGGKEAK
jgi:hypothetical protein